MLNGLILGESLLNDAMAIVLCHVLGHYFTDSASAVVSDSLSENTAVVQAFVNLVVVFFGSTAVGIIIASFNALLEKFAPSIHSHPQMETALFVLISYSSYLTAQVSLISRPFNSF